MSEKPQQKKREQRHKCKLDIKHDVVIPDIYYDGTIFNISRSGIYFESNEPIFLGDEISVSVKKPDEEEIAFDVCVIWKKDLSNSSYIFGYGAQTINPKDTKMQVRNKRDINITEAEDKRRFQRVDFNKKIRMGNKSQEFRGRIQNISSGGAFVETDSKFPIGKKIVFSLSGIKAEKKVKLTGWIVRKDNKGFGITFDRRSGSERRYDIDRRMGLDRRISKKRKIK